MAGSMGGRSLESCSDGNLLCHDKMAFSLFHVSQEDLPSRVIGYPDIYLSVRQKILYKIGVGLYLVLTSLFFNK